MKAKPFIVSFTITDQSKAWKKLNEKVSYLHFR